MDLARRALNLFSPSAYLVMVNCDTSFSDTNPAKIMHLVDLFADSMVAIIGPKILSVNGLLHVSCFSFDPTSIMLKPLGRVKRSDRVLHVTFLSTLLLKDI